MGKPDRVTIYLLDDDPVIQTILARELSGEGFSVVGGTQWSEVARQILALRDGHAILVADLDMPGIRGEDFCKTVLRYKKEQVRIVLYSAAERGLIEETSARLGGLPFVLKRDGPARLREVVRELAVGIRMRAQPAEPGP